MHSINVYNDNSKLSSVIYQNSCVLKIYWIHLQFYTLLEVCVKRNVLQASILTESLYKNKQINIRKPKIQYNNVQKSFASPKQGASVALNRSHG